MLINLAQILNSRKQGQNFIPISIPSWHVTNENCLQLNFHPHRCQDMENNHDRQVTKHPIFYAPELTCCLKNWQESRARMLWSALQTPQSPPECPTEHMRGVLPQQLVVFFSIMIIKSFAHTLLPSTCPLMLLLVT